ncbi:hypothetical protein IHE26_07370 [Plesiomonas shigelloides]|uniref:hypothetical protein n=1 Tax=Plesiomonas shigelloides TaxID=703 RepID=UPI00177C21C1|nr:hypothetical protein [Plesiomonas shigelloides]QOH81070.1 hypothetical protein IHE26_07370 [Plesiomonas shigelloides]
MRIYHEMPDTDGSVFALIDGHPELFDSLSQFVSYATARYGSDVEIIEVTNENRHELWLAGEFGDFGAIE